jgi:ElaB/YqjD/DUF883 family membrane-anchored ribosome-binding protein
VAVPRLLSALLAVLALASCGGGGNDYADDFPPVDHDLAALGSDVEATVRSANSSSDAELARSFSNYARRLSEIRDRLDQLDPPSSLKSEHARLTAAATATERALGDLASAARAGDAAAASAAATRLVRSGQVLDSAREKIANSAELR